VESIATKMNAPSAARPANEGRGWIAHIVWVVPAVLVFAPTIRWLWQRWTISVWENIHGMFIPFIVAYLIAKELGKDRIEDAEQSPWGFLFLMVGLGLVVLDSAIRTQLLSAFGMLVCLPGLSLLLLGSRRTQALAFVWVLSFFMLPIPAAFIDWLNLLLRRVTAAGAEQLMPLFDVPVGRLNTTLVLPTGPFFITDACSGFSILYASFTLALILAYVHPSWPRRVITLVAVFPITMALNILRVAFLVVMVQHWGVGFMDTPMHPASGFVAGGAAIVLVAVLGGMKLWGRAA